MTTKFTIESLAKWIAGIKEAAKNDDTFSVAWFPETSESFFSIVAGWLRMPNMPEEFCTSKSQPEYTMCVKIAINEEAFYIDFELMTMPINANDEVDDTCIPLEWDDSPEAVAEFFMHEWERIMTEHMEEI